MKKYFIAASDAAFYLLAGFTLSFIVLNYFTPRPASIILAVTFALIITIFAARKSFLASCGKIFDAENNKRFRAVMENLNMSDDKTLCELFLKVLKKQGFTVEKKSGALYIEEPAVTVFPLFGFDGVTKTDIVRSFNKAGKNRKAEIYSENFSESVSDFAARFGGKVILKDGAAAYELLNSANLLPETDNCLKEKARKRDFRLLFDKKRAKNYLVFGLLFTFLSYFVPIKTYYLIFGAAFLTLALILRLFGKTAA